MKLVSTAFADGAAIPRRFTCDGENLSPPLRWSDAPAGARSFALLCDDPDAPAGTWHHWAAYDIPPDTTTLAENAAQGTKMKQAVTIFGTPVMADRVHRLATGLTTTTFVCSPFPRTIFGWKQAHLVATSSERRENSRLPKQRSSVGTRDDKPDGNNGTVLAGWPDRPSRPQATPLNQAALTATLSPCLASPRCNASANFATSAL